MLDTRVTTKDDALLYLAKVLLTTVAHTAGKKTKLKFEYKRHIQIAQTTINYLIKFNIPPNDFLIKEVLDKFDGYVDQWAKSKELI